MMYHHANRVLILVGLAPFDSASYTTSRNPSSFPVVARRQPEWYKIDLMSRKKKGDKGWTPRLKNKPHRVTLSLQPVGDHGPRRSRQSHNFPQRRITLHPLAYEPSRPTISIAVPHLLPSHLPKVTELSTVSRVRTHIIVHVASRKRTPTSSESRRREYER